MAYASIAYTTPQYEDYPNWWLKAYEQGTTTPLAMALDILGAVTVAKLEINSAGFPESAGGAMVIPYIDGFYDLWLFPTAAEADANDTSNALLFANNIDAGSTDNNSVIALIDAERPIVATYAEMVTAGATMTAGDVVVLTGDNISGSAPQFKKVTDVGHGITSTSGDQVTIDVDNYLQRLRDVGDIFIDHYDEGSDQLNFDAAQSDSAQAYNFNFGADTYELNILNNKSRIIGLGAATVLSPVTGDPVITLAAHPNPWDYLGLGRFTIDGGGTGLGTGSIGVQFSPVDGTAGRYSFNDILFNNCITSVDMPVGHIANDYRNCTWINTDYAIKSQSSPTSHAGLQTVHMSHFDNVRLATWKINETLSGAGGHILEHSIIEGSPGFGMHCDYGDAAPITPPQMNSVWMELNQTSGQVDLGAGLVDPREMYVTNTPYAMATRSYMKNVEAVNMSTIMIADARIDSSSAPTTPFAMISDDSSAIIGRDIYANGTIGGGPLIRNVVRQVSTSNTLNLSYRRAFFCNRIPVANMTNATLVIGNSYSSAGPHGAFSGAPNVTPTSVTDGVLGGPAGLCAEMVIGAGNTVRSNPAVAPGTGLWACWGIHAKVVSGSITSIAIENSWTAGSVYYNTGEWVGTGGVQEVASTGTTRLTIETAAGCTIRIADFFLVTFPNYAQALAFQESGFAAMNEI